MSSVQDNSFLSRLESPVEQKRCWMLLFDGTWCDRTTRRGTVIGKLDRMLVNDLYQVKRYVKGIGSSHSVVEKYIGGGTGHGIRAKLFDIWVDLVSNYVEGDEIILMGYSRGAYMAVILASLLDLAGLPQDQDDEVTQDLFNKYWNNELEDPGTSRNVKDENSCIDVPIKFLGCFDAVGALGVPHTGILEFLNWAPKMIRSLEFNNTTLPSNVLIFRHALALHEYRAPFTPTLMHIPSQSNRDVSQVWFSGSHHNLGINKPGGTGLVNIALAWMISEMLAIGVRFQAAALQRHFPCWTNPSPADNYTATIHSTWTISFKATGYKARVPGSFGLAGLKTNEKIHRSVRLRRAMDPLVIPGHVLTNIHEGHEGVPVWTKTGSWKKNGTWIDDKSAWGTRPSFMDRTDLLEAAMNMDEKRLLGWGL